VSNQKVGTKEFAQAVVVRIGQTPTTLPPAKYGPASSTKAVAAAMQSLAPQKKSLVGVDVFLDWTKGRPDDLGAALSKLGGDKTRLQAVFNRGTVVWPNGFPETFCTDHWRARFLRLDGAALDHRDVIDLLGRISQAGYDFIKTEHLYDFDGKPGYSAGPARG